MFFFKAFFLLLFFVDVCCSEISFFSMLSDIKGNIYDCLINQSEDNVIKKKKNFITKSDFRGEDISHIIKLQLVSKDFKVDVQRYLSTKKTLDILWANYEFFFLKFNDFDLVEHDCLRAVDYEQLCLAYGTISGIDKIVQQNSVNTVNMNDPLLVMIGGQGAFSRILIDENTKMPFAALRVEELKNIPEGDNIFFYCTVGSATSLCFIREFYCSKKCGTVFDNKVRNKFGAYCNPIGSVRNYPNMPLDRIAVVQNSFVDCGKDKYTQQCFYVKDGVNGQMYTVFAWLYDTRPSTTCIVHNSYDAEAVFYNEVNCKKIYEDYKNKSNNNEVNCEEIHKDDKEKSDNEVNCEEIHKDDKKKFNKFINRIIYMIAFMGGVFCCFYYINNVWCV
ncbi:MAG TPA: hypothetical protein VLB80_01265 [Candidatus Babeliales bacterium]|nr:hypothetical protein [Candidatus Babeliales bacterium]